MYMYLHGGNLVKLQLILSSVSSNRII